jgi:hypothetical protein
MTFENSMKSTNCGILFFNSTRIFLFWFYFLNLQNDMLIVILLCLCRHSKWPEGLFALDPDDRERFFAEHFGAVNRLFEHFELDEKDNEVLSTQIGEYMEQKRNPPYRN